MFKALDISGLPKGNFRGGFNSVAPPPAAPGPAPAAAPPSSTSATPAVTTSTPAAVAPTVGPVPYPPVARVAPPPSTAPSATANSAGPPPLASSTLASAAPLPAGPSPATPLPATSAVAGPSRTADTPKIAFTASSISLSSAPRPATNATPLFKAPSSLAPSDAEVSDLDELESDEEVPLASTYANAVASTSAAVAKSPKKKRQSFVRIGGTTNVAKILLPHYTIKRASPNSKLNPHVLSIHDGVTDASRARWPTNTTPGGKINGALNWYEEQFPGDVKYEQWKEKLGKEVAELLKETQTTAGGKTESWVIEDFPAEYKLVLHHTPSKSGSSDRLDMYLFGSPAAAKFRTVNEFAPHLYWLLMNGPGNEILCKCKYCGKTTQTAVNRALGMVSGHESGPKRESQTPDAESRPAKKAKLDKPKIDKPKVVDKPKVEQKKKVPKKRSMSPTYDGAYVSRERDADLHDGTLYREGELVWFELDRPFVSANPEGGADLVLSRWPGMITNRSVRNEAKRLAPLEPGKPPSIGIATTFVYNIKPLCCDDDYQRTESQVMPFIAYQPDELQMSGENALRSTEGIKLVWDGKRCWRPSLKKMNGGFFDAVTPLALAMQIASHLVAKFCLQTRYAISPSHAIIDPAKKTPAIEKQIAEHADNWHYQSLWWGAERIWTGELVRLLVDATQQFTSMVPRSPTSDRFSLFLKISGIYRESTTVAGMVMGSVYELRDLSADTVVDGGGGSAMSLFEKTSSAARSRDDERLPAPPEGYAFRRLTKPGMEVAVDIEYVAGRYYPLPPALASREASDAVIRTMVRKASMDEAEDDGMELGDEVKTEDHRRIALAGLVPASRLFMRCIHWSVSRTKAISSCEQLAQTEMAHFFGNQGKEEDIEE